MERDSLASAYLYMWGSFNEQGGDFADDSLYDSANSRSQRVDNGQQQDFLQRSGHNPIMIKSLKNQEIALISTGKTHSAMVTCKGELYMIGANDGGQMGIGEFSGARKYDEPVLIKSLLYQNIQIDQISCGHSHTLAVSREGNVFSWGYGKFGALGHGDFESVNQPQEIMFFSQPFQGSIKVNQISCGAHHSSLLDSQGKVFLWGAGEVGQLGQGERINECSPKLLKLPDIGNSSSIEMVTCGYFHTIIITSLGKILQTGQIKDASDLNDYSIVSTFQQIQAISNNSIRTVKAKDYSAALSTDGFLIVWKTPNSPQFVKLSQQIDDFDLCKQFVVIRAGSTYYKWYVETQKLEELNLAQSNGANVYMVSCGPTYIIGLTKKVITNQTGNQIYDCKDAYISRTSEKYDKKEYSSRQSSANPLRIKNQQQIDTYQSRTISREKIVYPLRKSLNPMRHSKLDDNVFSNNSLRQSSKDSSKFNANASNIKEKISNNSNIDNQSFIYESKQIENNESPFQLRDSSFKVNQSNQGQSIRFSYENKSLLSQQHDRYENTDNRSPDIINARQSSAAKVQFSLQKSTQKRRELQEILSHERERRIQAENQIASVYEEFEQFKKEVGVDQMRQVLHESKDEYQKLYDICLQECEKSAKLNEMWKQEKMLKEEREIQIIEMGEEIGMHKNQLKYQEEQMAKFKEEYENEMKIMKLTVSEQQHIIDNQREQFQTDKSELIKKKFDLEEKVGLQKEEILNLRSQTQELLRRLKEEQQVKEQVEEQKQQFQAIVHQKVNELVVAQDVVKNYEKLKQDHEILLRENQNIQSMVQCKNNSLKECDFLITYVRANENELKLQIQKLESAQKTKPATSTQHSYRSTTPRAALTKKDNPLQKTQTQGKPQPQGRNQGLQQTQSSNTTYGTRKQSIQQQQHSQQQHKQIPKKEPRQKEQSPEKLSKMIKLQDQNTQNFIKEINKIVGSSPILSNQNKARASRSSSPLNSLSTNKAPKVPQTVQNKQSLKQSPISSSRIKFASTNFNDEITPQSEVLQDLTKDEVTIEDYRQKCIFEDDECSQSSKHSQSQIIKPLEEQKPQGENEINAFVEETSSVVDQNKKKQVTFKIESSKEGLVNQAFQDTLIQKQPELQDSEISKLYESLSEEMKGLKGTNVDDLKGKLDAIRKNKILLEEKIKQYEKKLGN